MEQRHFILYQNGHTEEQDGQKEVLQSLRVEEVLADKRRKTVFADICFYSDSIPAELRGIFRRLAAEHTDQQGQQPERGAA